MRSVSSVPCAPGVRLRNHHHRSLIRGVLGSFGDLRQEPNNSVYLASSLVSCCLEFNLTVLTNLLGDFHFYIVKTPNSFALIEGGYYVSPLKLVMCNTILILSLLYYESKFKATSSSSILWITSVLSGRKTPGARSPAARYASCVRTGGPPGSFGA
jgi:hypothetical protein